MDRTLPLTPSEQRFWQAIRELERNTPPEQVKQFHASYLVDNRRTIAPLLNRWFETTRMPDARYGSSLHLISKQAAIELLWKEVLAYKRRRDCDYITMRRLEILQFCVREAYKLGMSTANDYYKTVRLASDWPTRIIVATSIPAWRILARYH